MIITYSLFKITVAFTVIFFSCAVIVGYRRDFASRPWKSAYCVISAFERWLVYNMYTRNARCGRETVRCRCKLRYVSKFTAASRSSLFGSTAVVILPKSHNSPPEYSPNCWTIAIPVCSQRRIHGMQYWRQSRVQFASRLFIFSYLSLVTIFTYSVNMNLDSWASTKDIFRSMFKTDHDWVHTQRWVKFQV